MRTGAIWFAAVFAGLMNGSAVAETIDPHQLFEERCGRCHGHAGPFAREAIVKQGDTLLGRKQQQDLRLFLPRHFAKLTPQETEVLLRAFSLQIDSAGIYEEKCLICHERAQEVARLRLVLDGDTLKGRYSGNDIAQFLSFHGRLSDEEAGTVTGMLRWQLDPDTPAAF